MGLKNGAPSKVNLLIVFAILLTMQVNAQIVNNKSFYYKARLVSSKTNESVIFANIINLKTRFGAISDSSGIFLIPASIGDMLMISSIGFQKKYFTITDSMKYQFYIPEIKLQDMVYELGYVDVRFFGTYQEFKYRVLHTKPDDDPFKILNSKLKKEIDSITSLPINDLPTISLGSPITAIYMMFSKEGKEIRKLEKVVEKQPAENIINTKYNRTILENATGLKDAELNEFVLFCRPSDDFLVKASEYEIHEQIQKCLEKFKKRNQEKEVKK